jgi:hypothetical protein
MIDKTNEQIDQAGPTNGIAGAGDASLESLMVQSRTKQPDIPSKLLEGDIKPEKFIPRAHLDERLATSILRLTMDNNILATGKANMNHVMWLSVLQTMGLDGWATDNVVSIFAANHQRRERVGLIGRMLGQRRTKRDINGQEHASSDAI